MKERENYSPESVRYQLLEHCRSVFGAKRAAIYDLEKGEVYSINESAREILSGSVDEFGFWEKLKGMGLVEASHNTSSSNIESEISQVGLEFMWLELTEKCNQKCLHCYASAGDLIKAKDMPVANWERIIEEGSSMGCRKLQFIGGEPLFFEGIFDLAQTARELDYEFIEIFTNGTLLNEVYIQKIKDLELHVAISLYSTVPEVHDRVTQVPGSFQKTFRALEFLKEAQIPTRIGIIIMRQNEDVLLETKRKLEEMGFDNAGMDVLRPTGRGSCADLLPKDETISTWALMTKPDFSTSKEQFSRNQHWNSCWAGKIAVTVDGGIMPCIFAREHVVSNANIGLEEAVNSEGLQELWKITKDQIEGCQGCEYRYACHDCRSLAESATSNLYAKNPRCVYDPLRGEWMDSKKKGGEKDERTRTDD